MARITPHLRIQDGGDSAAAFHALGRHLQREGRLDDAERAYRRALDFDPAHLETRNAIAALIASRGDLAQAIAMLSELVATHPEQPHLLANLGYAHYMNGNYPVAKAYLEQALHLAPDNEATQRKLALVKEKLGETDNASESLQQASVPAQPAAISAENRHAVVRVSDGVYALTRAASAAEASTPAYSAQCEVPAQKTAQAASASATASGSASVAAPQQPVGDTRQRLRIELANGNGVNRLARTVRDLISPQWQVVRVVNYEAFSVPLTRIEYARNRYAEARELAHALGLVAQLRPNDQQGDTQLRVVFGRDFVSVDGLRERMVKAVAPALASLE